MNITFHPTAIKQVKKLPKPARKKIFHKLEQLEQEPHAGKLLQGEYKGYRSLRAWPYRIVYIIEGDMVDIVSVSHRQGVY